MSKNGIEKDFFKLMNNSMFWENMHGEKIYIRKRVYNCSLTSEETLFKLSSKPKFVISKICNENLVSVQDH